MKTVSHYCHWAFIVLCLVPIGCSDNKKTTKPGDAAAADAGTREGGIADQASPTDLGGKDGQPDVVRPDTDWRDLPDIPDARFAEDVPGDLSARPDSPTDATADLPKSETAGPDLSEREASSGDSSVDQAVSCGPDGGGCNDDSWYTGGWAACNTNGTCTCKVGFEINPKTGRCRAMTPVSGSDAAAVCTDTYDACGCGCCGAVPTNTACYYPTAGESTATVKAKDDEARAGVDCSAAGCSSGVRHVCCVPATPEPTSSASYATDSYMGDMDHISISKMGSDCAELMLSRPGTTKSTFHVDGPAAWGLMYGGLVSCGDGGAMGSPLGALGSISLHASGDQCLIDVHVTLFSFPSTGETKTTRLDVDDLVVKDFPGSFCK